MENYFILLATVFLGIFAWVIWEKRKKIFSRSKNKAVSAAKQNKEPNLPKRSLFWKIASKAGILFFLAIVAAIAFMLVVTAISMLKDGQEEADNSYIPSYPASGSLEVSQENPGHAYLDPMRTHTYPQGTVKYVFEKQPSFWIIEDGPREDNSGIDEHKWWSMPAGNYSVIPIDPGEKLLFKWY